VEAQPGSSNAASSTGSTDHRDRWFDMAAPQKGTQARL